MSQAVCGFIGIFRLLRVFSIPHFNPHTCYRAHGRIAGRDWFDAFQLFRWHGKQPLTENSIHVNPT